MARIGACLRAIADASATQTQPLPFGRALVNERFPRVWDMNFVRVEGSRPTLEAETVAEAAERLIGAAGLSHRKVAVEDEATGRRLAPRFAALGWRQEESLAMTHRRPPERLPLEHRVEEVAEESLRSFRESCWALKDPPGADQEVVRQLAARASAIPPAMRRHFAVLRYGEVASCCDLYKDGRAAQVESVGTAPRHARQGMASAVVLEAVAAAREAGWSPVFLLAARYGGPRRLYTRLGFEAIVRCHDFLKAPDD